jgi:protein-disulfide isomerase
VLGPRSAPVSIVEYGDYECPSCAQAHSALQIVVHRYAAAVCLAYRHFPIVDAHPHAFIAAEAAEAAGAQGRFWPFHDLLFANELHLDRAHLNRCALALGLDMMRFERDLDTHACRARIESDIASGKALHVMSTPAVYVNGRLCDVSFGLERLEEAIAAALAG